MLTTDDFCIGNITFCNQTQLDGSKLFKEQSIIKVQNKSIHNKINPTID